MACAGADIAVEAAPVTAVQFPFQPDLFGHMRAKGKHGRLCMRHGTHIMMVCAPATLRQQGLQTPVSLWPRMRPKAVLRVQVLRRRLRLVSRAPFRSRRPKVCTL